MLLYGRKIFGKQLMKLHHLRTAFLVTCLLLVCSQGRSGIVGGDILGDPSQGTPPVIDIIFEEFDIIIDTVSIEVGTDDIILNNNTIINNNAEANNNNNAEANNNDTIDIIFEEFDIIIDTVSIEVGTDDIILNNADPAVPEPTTLSLLAMSLLLVGRRWR